MSGVNMAIIMGRLTRDPEMRQSQSGMNIASFSVATSRKKKGGEETSEFHNMVAFAKTADLVGQYLKKGSQAHFVGELKTDTWDDKETGKKMYKTSIIVNQMQFVGSPSGGQQGQQQQPQQQQGQQQSYPTDQQMRQGFQQPPQQQYQQAPPPQQAPPTQGPPIDDLPF